MACALHHLTLSCLVTYFFSRPDPTRISSITISSRKGLTTRALSLSVGNNAAGAGGLRTRARARASGETTSYHCWKAVQI